MGLLQTIQRGAKRLKDQLDPFDGGKTWQNPTPQARPQANPYSRNQYNQSAQGAVNPPHNAALDIMAAPKIQIPTTPQPDDSRSLFSKGFDQLNPLDNGRTFKNDKPLNQRSIGQQITHNGVTNTAGNIAKPFGETAKYVASAGAVGLANAKRDQQLAEVLRGQRDKSFQASFVPSIDRTWHRAETVGLTPGSTMKNAANAHIDKATEQARADADLASQNAANKISSGIKDGTIDPKSGAQAINQILKQQELVNRAAGQRANQQLADAGFDINTSKLRMGAQTAGDAATTATFAVAPVSGAAMASLPLKKAVTTKAVDVATNAALGGIGTGGTAYGQGASAKDALKAGVSGAATAGVLMGTGGLYSLAKQGGRINRGVNPTGMETPAPTTTTSMTVKTPEAPKTFTDFSAPQNLPSTLVTRTMAKTDAEYRALQDEAKARYNQTRMGKIKNAVASTLYDSRPVEQRLDNAEFKRQKKAGLTEAGQSDLLPDQSLAVQRGRIQNPGRAAEVRNKEKFDGGNGFTYSINDIIKHYGKEGSDKARAFENYRIYKDELERLAMGHNNSVGLDPRVMADYVANYERTNPLAIAHNHALRAASLKLLYEKNQARIDKPEIYANSSKFRYYNPREGVTPEELIRPRMTGGVRSGAKVTEGRSPTAGGPVASPLSLFRKQNELHEKALAEQRYGMELRRRTQAGEKGFTEVTNADDVIVRKQLLALAKEASAKVKSTSLKLAHKRADLRTANVFTGGAQHKAALKAKQLLKQTIKDPDAVSAVDSMSRKDLVQVFRYMTEENYPNIERLRKNLVKRTANTDKMLAEIDGLKAQIAKDQQDASAYRSGSTEFQGSYNRGEQTYTYKLDGEIGKIEIPADLAESLSKQNEMINRNYVERGLTPLAAAQKLTWTGPLQPAFKVWNVVVKNPLLAFRNADGLSGVRPEALLAVARQVVNTDKMAQFKKDMNSRGMAYENALETRNIYSVAADDIAARKNLITFFNRNPVKTLGDVWRGLGQAFASADNAQRYAVAYGAYKRAKGLGFDDARALDIASQAPAKAFGDFDRVTRLAQNMEVLIPYSGATQAGTRALLRASKTKPVSTTFKDVALLGGMVSLGAYSISNAKEYYDDMIASNKRYELDNNWTIALPGASKGKDGQWHGILKVPLTPDFRPANRAAWQSVYSEANGKGLNGRMIAGEIFNQMTGDSGNQVYALENTNHKKNLVNGLLPSSPLVNLGKTLNGVNIRTGEPLADEYTASRPRTEQENKNTTPGAKKTAQLTGGTITPLQADQIFGMMGNTGDILQAKKNTSPGRVTLESIAKPVQAPKGMTPKNQKGKDFGGDVSAVGTGIKNKDDFRVFQALVSKNSEKTPDDGAARAKELLARPGVLKAFAEMDKRKRARGEEGDPFFDLTPDQQKKVLRYRGAKDLNSAKQAYDKNGNPLFTALGLDEKWYSDYKDREDAQFAKLKNKSELLTYSGAKKPDNKAIKPVEDAYYKLPKGTGARKAYLAAHPELTDYWAQSNQFSDAERVALGLKPVTDDGSSGSGGYGKGGYGSKGNKFTASDVTNPYSSIIKNVGALNKKVGSSKIKAAPLKSKVKKPGIRKK